MLPTGLLHNSLKHRIQHPLGTSVKQEKVERRNSVNNGKRANVTSSMSLLNYSQQTTLANQTLKCSFHLKSFVMEIAGIRTVPELIGHLEYRTCSSMMSAMIQSQWVN